jgi:hypothetical protein
VAKQKHKGIFMPFLILWIATSFKVCQNRGKLVHVKEQKNILLL